MTTTNNNSTTPYQKTNSSIYDKDNIKRLLGFLYYTEDGTWWHIEEICRECIMSQKNITKILQILYTEKIIGLSCDKKPNDLVTISNHGRYVYLRDFCKMSAFWCKIHKWFPHPNPKYTNVWLCKNCDISEIDLDSKRNKERRKEYYEQKQKTSA